MATNEELLRAIKALTGAVKKLSGESSTSGGSTSTSTRAARARTALEEQKAQDTFEKAATDMASGIAGRTIKDQQELVKILEEQLKLEELQNLALEERARVVQSQNAMAQSVSQRKLQLDQKSAQILAELIEANMKVVETSQMDAEEKEKQLGLLQAQLDGSKAQIEQLKAQAAVLEKVRDQYDTIAGMVMLSSRAYEKSFFGQLEQASGGINSAYFKGLAMGLAEIGEAAIKSFHPMGLFSTALGSIKDSTIGLVKAQDAALASFAKSTGQLGDLQQVIVTTKQENISFFVSIEQATKSLQALTLGFRGFNRLADESQVELNTFIARLDNMGVSSETSVALLNESFHALGMSLKDTTEMMGELYKASQVLGVGQENLMQEFKASLPVLARYGDKANEVFLGVAATAKAAGLQTSDLLSTMGQFDTFQGAAQAVSSLNAILGGQYLNSIEMVNMNEHERARAIRMSMEASGRSFANMSKHEKMAIATAMGISDMTVANKLFGMSVAEMDAEIERSQGLGSLSEEEMAQATQAMMTFGEKISTLFQSFTLAVEPFLGAIGFMIDKFTLLVKAFQTNKLLKLAGAFIIALGGAKLFSLGLGLTTKAVGGAAASHAALAAATAHQTAVLRAGLAAQLTAQGVQTTGTLLDATSTATKDAETAATLRSAGAERVSAVARGISSAATVTATAIKALFVKEAQLEAAAIGLSTVAKARDLVVSGMAAVINGLVNLTMIQNNKLTLLGVAAKYVAIAATGLLAVATTGLGAALLFLMSPMGLVVAGLALLAYYIMAPVHSPPLYIGMGMLAGGVIALAVAMKFGTPALSAGAKAMFKLGAGTSLTALAMAVFAVALAGVVLTSLGAAVTLTLLGGALALIGVAGAIAGPGLAVFSLGLGILTLALLGFATTSFITLPILSGLSLSFLGLGAGMALMATFGEKAIEMLKLLPSAVESASISLRNLSLFDGLLVFKSMVVAAAGVQILAASILSAFPALLVLHLITNEFERLATAINSLELDKMFSVEMTMRSISMIQPGAAQAMSEVKQLVQATAEVDPESGASVTDMMKAATKLAEASVAAQVGVIEQMASMVVATQDTGTIFEQKAKEAAAGTRGATEIKLYMDRDGRKVFARGIMGELMPEIDGKLSINKR